MSIEIKYFGDVPPGPNAKPKWAKTFDKLPFGKKNPIDWHTGKHAVQLNPEVDVPRGTEDDPHLVWDPGLNKWVKGLIEGLPLLEDTAAGPIAFWNGEEWIYADMTDIAEGDVPEWDGEKYVPGKGGIDNSMGENGDMLMKIDGEWVAVSALSLVRWNDVEARFEVRTGGSSESPTYSVMEGGVGISLAEALAE